MAGSDLKAINPDKTQQRVLISAGGLTDPQLSPDRTRLVYVGAQQLPGFPELFLANADGSTPRILTAGGQTLNATSPSFSPDGRQLAFVRFNNVPRGIHTLNVDGTGLRFLPGTEQAQFSRGTAWSPNGKQIAFVQAASSGAFGLTDLFLINSDGTGLRRVRDLQGIADPEFSPDGKTIVCSAITAPGNRDLYSVAVDGSSVRQLTSTAVLIEESPSFSPDGQRLVFGRRRLDVPPSTPEETPGLYIANADGSNPTLFTNGVSDREPNWR